MNSMVINDVGSAAISSMGVLAALFARQVTGRGMEVLTSMANVSLTVQAGEMAEYDGRKPNIPGGRDLRGDEPLHHLYKCADGHWLAISAATEERFAALAKVLGREDLLKTYKGKAIGADRDGPLTKVLAEAFGTVNRDETLDKLLAAGVPCAPAIRAEESFGDTYLWDNNVFDDYFSPRHGDAFTQTPCLVHWGRSRSRNYERPSPDIGEHTEEVLQEFGIDDARVRALMERRILFSTKVDA
jgi:crotonobetainyl-CoA:carnitine CoA-transferase CaiB-like acyl-CoA transferase